MSITLDKIEKLRATLSGLPEADESRRKVGTRKAVHLLRKDINALKRKGYTLEMIAEQLRAGGLGLSRATLKRYMCRRSQRAEAPRVKDALRPAGSADDE